MNRLIDHLRRLVEQPLGDEVLLDRFIERREDTAFATLVKRHGPMVLAVCRRILGNPQDAEDAFQATFLVLARRASSVRPRAAVGNWLYGVAYRTALAARAKITRRFTREKQMEEMPETEEQKEACGHELLSLLDRELHHLPDKYRLPVVLCDLQGRSRKEVARQMGIPEGTLSSRLAIAHKKLAWRLSRLGLMASGASLAMLLAENTALAQVPPLLVVATTKGAVLLTAGQAVGVSVGVIALTEGVLRAMFIAKVKTATVLLCGVATLGLGTGGIWYHTRVGAADFPILAFNRLADQAEARRLDDNSEDDAARQEKDVAKRAAQEARLRAAVEKARREAEAQQDRTEAERSRAQEALRQLKEQLAKAKEEEKLARKQAKKTRSADKAQKPKQDVNRLSEAETKTREQFKKARQTLMEQLKKLDAEEREALRKLKTERSLLQKQQKSQGGDKASPSGDKLDRILERLERMERRLDRLERGSKK
jgi:RNA polymerase sigma factor (sigma-70 family)